MQNGKTHDYSESAFVARFSAAAMGLLYLPSKALLGTGMQGKSPDVADEYGNVQWPVVRDSDDIDQIMASASKRLIVTVEKIIPHQQEVRGRPALTYIPHTLVEALIEVPYATHPTATDGFYNEDEAAAEGLAAGVCPRLSCAPRRYGKVGSLAALSALDVTREFTA